MVYGEEGLVRDHNGSVGDSNTALWHRDRPFTLDPTARPANVRPVSALVHPDLGRVPRTPSHLADLFDADAPASRCAFRVRVPPRSPSGIRDTWVDRSEPMRTGDRQRRPAQGRRR